LNKIISEDILYRYSVMGDSESGFDVNMSHDCDVGGDGARYRDHAKEQQQPFSILDSG
jgi:hypothetical protein